MVPELPAGTALTSVSNMFYGIPSKISVTEDYFSNCPNIKSAAALFYNCFELTGRLPALPATITGSINNMFSSCYKLTGSFPAIPEGVTTMYQVFYNCYKIEGQLPDIPSTATDIRQTFYNCYKATGRIPSLGHLSKLTAGTYCTSTFYGCSRVEDPPITFLDPVKAASQTSFAEMFYGCSRLKNFDFDLSGFEKVTTVTQMFRGCTSLKTAPKRLPPNITIASNLFYEALALSDEIISYTDYVKLINIGCMYYRTPHAKPMKDAAGNIITDKSKIWNSRITTVTNAF